MLLFPEPDSPTSASVQPGKIENETESTAVNASARRPSPRLPYRFTKFSTRITGSILSPAPKRETSSRKPHDDSPSSPPPAREPGRVPSAVYSAAQTRHLATVTPHRAPLPQSTAHTFSAGRPAWYPPAACTSAAPASTDDTV